MGVAKEKRPILATEGIQAGETTSPSTFSSPVTISGLLTLSSGQKHPVQTVSLSGASAVGTTAVTAVGVTVITSTGTGAGWTLNLAAPAAAGIQKVIAINPKSTVPVKVRTASSSHEFLGSTANAFEASTVGTTGNLIGKAKVIELVSISASQWAVKNFFPQNTTGSTYLTLLGATA